ncbi:hypothetical protein WJX72_003945 [[Myrmecia] bisecta]|uniref:phosphopantothenoylcysteine decarboxylase n=1 Tax=[Myrmecia] bisecta TaxID=41462 RepID=A0AAW1P591_9CHLO
MHPPLHVHKHPHCKELILALQKCHEDHPYAKFWGKCNQQKWDLDRCFREEKKINAALNRRQTQAAVLERLDSNAAPTVSQRQDSFNSPPAANRRPHVLLAVSGSVAAIKVPELALMLASFADVRTIATQAARHFLSDNDLPVAARPLHGDEEEWKAWRHIGDPVMHIELRRWADVMVIAPLSANTMAKLAHGLSDNLLTCVVRAWDFNKPLLVAPAMNTYMWESPFTTQHINVLTTLGVKVIPPVSKKLACGDVGGGAMASPEDIAAHIRAAVNLA